MKMISIAVVALWVFTGSAEAFEPIPGSLLYEGQPQHLLEKAPVGSTFENEFSSGANRYKETYMILPDRNLRIIGRTEIHHH